MSKSVEIIQGRSGAASVRLKLMIGSGLGHLARAVNLVSIPYADLPCFKHVSVWGHNPSLHVGTLQGCGSPCWARAHNYEKGSPSAMRMALKTVRALGADTLIAINAAGSLWAASLSDEKISHEQTKAMAPFGASKLERNLRAYLRGLG